MEIALANVVKFLGLAEEENALEIVLEIFGEIELIHFLFSAVGLVGIWGGRGKQLCEEQCPVDPVGHEDEMKPGFLFPFHLHFPPQYHYILAHLCIIP